MKKKTLMLGGMAAATMLVLSGCASGSNDSSESGGDGGYRIAFANSTIGNSWHQEFIKSIENAADEALEAGTISAFDSAIADNDPTEQANQIRSFTVAGYDAILVNATSATALNSAIKQACDAGIVVVGIDQTVTEPCAYNVFETFEAVGEVQAEVFAEAMGGTGNILEVRGTAGTEPDEQMHNGAGGVLADFPDIKIVGEVFADWTDTVAQQQVSAILPSLPEIDAVIGQGGDGAGSARAFEAAGREMPMIGFGNRGNELRIWKDLLDADPEYIGVSLCSMPGIGSAGFWTAIAILDEEDVPMRVQFPLLDVTVESLDAWIEATPEDSVASTTLTYEQTLGLIASNNADEVPRYVEALPGKFEF